MLLKIGTVNVVTKVGIKIKIKVTIAVVVGVLIIAGLITWRNATTIFFRWRDVLVVIHEDPCALV